MQVVMSFLFWKFHSFCLKMLEALFKDGEEGWAFGRTWGSAAAIWSFGATNSRCRTAFLKTCRTVSAKPEKMLAPARTLTSPFWWFYFRKSWRTSTKRLPRWKEVKVRGNWNVFGRGPLANPFPILVLNGMLEHEKRTSSFWQGHLKMCWIKINLMLVRRNSAAEFLGACRSMPRLFV